MSTILPLGGHSDVSLGVMMPTEGGGLETIVVELRELLDRSGSNVSEVTDPVTVSDAPLRSAHRTLTVITIALEAPEASVDLLQFTVPALPTAGVVQVQPAGEIDAKVAVPAGMEAVNFGFSAASRFEFATVK